MTFWSAQKAGYTVSVLGVGTQEGARLQTAQGRVTHIRDGQEVTVSLDAPALTALAQAGGGDFAAITACDADLDRVFLDQSPDLQGIGDSSDQTSETWMKFGFYLLLVPVLLTPLVFRRGVLMMLALGVVAMNTVAGGAQAGTWDDLWQTPGQWAQQAYEAGNYADVAALYSTPDAIGAALYREGDFADAAQ